MDNIYIIAKSHEYDITKNDPKEIARKKAIEEEAQKSSTAGKYKLTEDEETAVTLDWSGGDEVDQPWKNIQKAELKGKETEDSKWFHAALDKLPTCEGEELHRALQLSSKELAGLKVGGIMNFKMSQSFYVGKGGKSSAKDWLQAQSEADESSKSSNGVILVMKGGSKQARSLGDLNPSESEAVMPYKSKTAITKIESKGGITYVHLEDK